MITQLIFTTFFVISFGTFGALASATVTAPAIATEYYGLSIFKTSALLEIQFTAEDEFSAEDIYHIEEASSIYLKELVTNDDTLPFIDQVNAVIDVNVDIKTQRVNEKEISLGSEVIVIHYGNVGIFDLAALLTFLVNRNITDSSFVYLDHMIQTNSSIELISFEFVSESIAIASNITATSEIEKIHTLQNSKYSGNEKTLLIVTTLLSVTLFGMSAILIWIGGGWLMLRKKVQVLLKREEELTLHIQQGGIQSKPTAETEEGYEEGRSNSSLEENQTTFTNPSGFLGVNNQYDNRGSFEKAPISTYGLGMKTPAKISGTTDEFETPMSVMSAYSTYSDTGRAPMGIMSMRKLVPSTQFLSPQQNQDDEHDATGETEENFAGTKRLEY